MKQSLKAVALVAVAMACCDREASAFGRLCRGGRTNDPAPLCCPTPSSCQPGCILGSPMADASPVKPIEAPKPPEVIRIVMTELDSIRGGKLNTIDGQTYLVDAKTEYSKKIKNVEMKATANDLKEGAEIDLHVEQVTQTVRKIVIK